MKDNRVPRWVRDAREDRGDRQREQQERATQTFFAMMDALERMPTAKRRKAADRLRRFIVNNMTTQG